jgi:hypothetical protein
MVRSRAWVNHQASRREAADLLAQAGSASDVLLPGQRMALQEVLLRAIVVVLVGQVHAYLEDLLEEWGDLLGADFSKLSHMGQKYVVLQVRRHLSETLDQYPQEALGDTAAQHKFMKALEDCRNWLQNPRDLATSPSRSRLEGFFRQWGANAIDRALAQLRVDGVGFFSWLTAQHSGYSDYFVRVNSAIGIRNEVAHGSFETRLTFDDARRHRATLSLLVLKAEDFVSGALEDARTAAAITATPTSP